MSGDLSGFSMFELFKSEAESHAQTLSDGLLALESDPADLSHVEGLMRAAHSIKGAARIVDLEAVVQLAHAMEDCFIAVQKGEEILTSSRVDQLLQGVDVFQSLAALPEQQMSEWLEANASACLSLADAVRQPVPEPTSIDSGESSAAEKPPAAEQESAKDQVASARAANSEAARPQATAANTEDTEVASTPAGSGDKPTPDTSRPQTPTAGDQPARRGKEIEAPAGSAGDEQAAREHRTVPVSATNLNRIMRLAGESMIDAQRLQSMDQSLENLQAASRHMSTLLDRLTLAVSGSAACAELNELRQLNQASEQMLQEHTTDLQQALWRSERTSTALYHQVIESRMRPFREGVVAFPRMIRDLSRALGKQVVLEIGGGAVSVDRDILGKLEAPLNHLLRNCVDHGIETPEDRRAVGKSTDGRIVLRARHHAGMLTVQVRDDGRGIDIEALRDKVVGRGLADAALAAELSHAELLEFLFLPGFSTASTVTEISGRGVGLDVVRNMVAEVSGTVRVDTEPGRSTTFTLRLPVTLSVIRAVLVEIAGEPYAFPLARLQRIVRVASTACQAVQGKQQFLLDGQSVGLVNGTEVLGLPGSAPAGDEISVVVLGDADQVCGLVVDRFIGEQDLVVRPLDPRLGRVPNVTAAATLENGDPLLIVDVEDLLRSMQQRLGEGRLRGMRSVTPEQARARRRVLVVDDSVTVREVQRQLLRAHGYDVDVAVDGQDGWHSLCAATYDLLITDVDMPRMNGIELIRAVRSDSRFADLPVIVVSYKAREEDRRLGLEVGANAYLTKGSFHDDSFMETVNDLIGAIE